MLSTEDDNNLSNKTSDENQQNANESLYLMSKSDKIKDDLFNNASPSAESDISNGSFSENSVYFCPKGRLSNDAPEDYRLLLGL